jgi:hypothetical protein
VELRDINKRQRPEPDGLLKRVIHAKHHLRHKSRNHGAAAATSRYRLLRCHALKPNASAPAKIAASASSLQVMPQIFTRTLPPMHWEPGLSGAVKGMVALG